MKENRDRTFEFIMKSEGDDFTNIKDDHGGATKYGVTLALLKTYKIDLNHDGKIDIEDVKLVTREIAEQIFVAYFWSVIDGDNLPGGIDLIAADIAYNSGGHKWRQFMKEGYGRVGTYGEIHDLVQRRIRFYEWQAKNVPGQSKFLDGWTAMAEASEVEAKKCVGVTA